MSNFEGDTSHDASSDRELVQAYMRLRGEQEFRVLYRRHTPALYRMAYRLAGAAAAEDAVQETWCRAARTMAQFEWRSTLLTWLTGILIRCCRESWSRNVGVLTLPVDAEPEEPEIENHTAIDLERGIEALPPGYREILVLHDVEGFTHAEIAKALAIMPGTSKSQLARARRALRQRLESNTTLADGEAAS
jgi:RNA polymerase sigma-70 factor (ECF subfamily)